MIGGLRKMRYGRPALMSRRQMQILQPHSGCKCERRHEHRLQQRLLCRHDIDATLLPYNGERHSITAIRAWEK
jgi:hypothetical protein